MKVGIVVPSGDMVHANFAFSLAALMHACATELTTSLVSVKGSNLPRQRSTAVAKCLAHGCDYILMLDSDMTFPRDTLQRLLAHKKDVVGASYVRRSPPHDPLHKTIASAKPANGLLEVAALPTGVLLINAKVFEKLQRPYFRYELLLEGQTKWGFDGPEEIGEDYVFSYQVREAGMKVWMDMRLSAEVVHWQERGLRYKPDGFDLVEMPS